jgi:hypothetical protein
MDAPEMKRSRRYEKPGFVFIQRASRRPRVWFIHGTPSIDARPLRVVIFRRASVVVARDESATIDDIAGDALARKSFNLFGLSPGIARQ